MGHLERDPIPLIQTAVTCTAYFETVITIIMLIIIGRSSINLPIISVANYNIHEQISGKYRFVEILTFVPM